MLIYDDDSHTYTLDGRVVPSVTQIIAPLYDFSRVDPQVLAAKAMLGKAVHRATELHDAGALDDGSVHPLVRPYLDAWLKFRLDTGFVPVEIEQRVHHPVMGYAGTLDRVGDMDSGERSLLDIKIVRALSPAVGVQLAAYEHAYALRFAVKPVLRRRAVQLRDDGSYRLTAHYTDPADLTCFLSLLNIHHWKEKHHE